MSIQISTTMAMDEVVKNINENRDSASALCNTENAPDKTPIDVVYTVDNAARTNITVFTGARSEEFAAKLGLKPVDGETASRLNAGAVSTHMTFVNGEACTVYQAAEPADKCHAAKHVLRITTPEENTKPAPHYRGWTCDKCAANHVGGDFRAVCAEADCRGFVRICSESYLALLDSSLLKSLRVRYSLYYLISFFTISRY